MFVSVLFFPGQTVAVLVHQFRSIDLSSVNLWSRQLQLFLKWFCMFCECIVNFSSLEVVNIRMIVLINRSI